MTVSQEFLTIKPVILKFRILVIYKLKYVPIMFGPVDMTPIYWDSVFLFYLPHKYSDI